MVSKRYARANNPKVEGYNPEKKTTWIQYLDANNLYGWAMSQPLPVGGFEWVEAEQCIIDHPVDSPYGHILEVDLNYPDSLQKVHNAYPLAPERMAVQKEWMSEYQHKNYSPGSEIQAKPLDGALHHDEHRPTKTSDYFIRERPL